MEKYLANFTNSITNKKIINKLTPFITLILSKHLYIYLLIPFSPYLLKLFTYLFPLFITTSLLLFSLFTMLIPLNSIVNSKFGFFATLYATLLEIIHHPKEDNEHGTLKLVEVGEVYKIVFETPLFSRIDEYQDGYINEFGETLVGFCKGNVQYESDENDNPHLSDDVRNEERMDLLWETYETEEVKEKDNRDQIKELMVISDNHEGSNGDNDEENSENGNLCCLKALKFSARKMNLSVGRSSLVKFGKVFKGIGWIHKHGRRKHAKKG